MGSVMIGRGAFHSAHLHYEVHVKGQVVNPVNYYFMDLSAEDYEKMIQLAANHGKVFD